MLLSLQIRVPVRWLLLISPLACCWSDVHARAYILRAAPLIYHSARLRPNYALPRLSLFCCSWPLSFPCSLCAWCTRLLRRCPLCSLPSPLLRVDPLLHHPASLEANKPCFQAAAVVTEPRLEISDGLFGSIFSLLCSRFSVRSALSAVRPLLSLTER